MNFLEKEAEKNMGTRFVDNPCRGIVLGMNGNDELVQLAWIMGRSSNSQNRVYKVENDVLRTKAVDPAKVKDEGLILYNAMRSVNKAHIVTNGVQTDTVYDKFSVFRGRPIIPKDFFGALEGHYCEPDPPIFTPRISGYQYDTIPKKNEPVWAFLSVLRADSVAKEKWLNTIEKHNLKEEQFPDKKAFNDEVRRLSGLNYNRFPTERDYFERTLRRGIGYCVTTYKPGHKALDSFDDTPFVVSTKGPLEDIMDNIWNHLEPDWRVSIGGKVVFKSGSYRLPSPINRMEKLEE